MKTYDEALKVWAARRFDFGDAEIVGAELVAVDATTSGYGCDTCDYEIPAHTDVRLTLSDGTSFAYEVTVPVAQLTYELFAAGMED